MARRVSIAQVVHSHAALLLSAAILAIFGYMFFFASFDADYVEGVAGRIERLNPVFSDLNEIDRDISRLIFSGLLRYDAPTASFLPDLATFSVGADQKTYQFVIREDAYFHDGKQVTAEDVFFTIHDVMQHPDFANPVLKANFADVSIKVVDERTVVIQFPHVNVFFPSNFTVGILPKHALQRIAVKDLFTDSFNESPVGSGPYKVAEAMKTFADGRTQISLKRFSKYYGPKYAEDSFRIIGYPSGEAMLKSSSHLNGMSRLQTEDHNSLEKFQLVPFMLPQYTALFFNTEQELLQDREVRRWLRYVIDKNVLLQKLHDKKRVDSPLLFENTTAQFSENRFPEAKKGLEKAGWKTENKLLFLVRKPLEGTRIADEVRSTVDFLTQSWEKIGVTVKVNMAEPEEFETELLNRKYDMTLAGHSLGYDQDLFAFWHSSQANAQGLNLSNYKSFAVDSFIEDIRRTSDSKLRQQKMKKLESKIDEDIPAIFLYRPISYYATTIQDEFPEFSGMAFTADRFSYILR